MLSVFIHISYGIFAILFFTDGYQSSLWVDGINEGGTPCNSNEGIPCGPYAKWADGTQVDDGKEKKSTVGYDLLFLVYFLVSSHSHSSLTVSNSLSLYTG